MNKHGYRVIGIDVLWKKEGEKFKSREYFSSVCHPIKAAYRNTNRRQEIHMQVLSKKDIPQYMHVPNVLFCSEIKKYFLKISCIL